MRLVFSSGNVGNDSSSAKFTLPAYLSDTSPPMPHPRSLFLFGTKNFDRIQGKLITMNTPSQHWAICVNSVTHQKYKLLMRAGLFFFHHSLPLFLLLPFLFVLFLLWFFLFLFNCFLLHFYSFTFISYFCFIKKNYFLSLSSVTIYNSSK